MAKSRKAPAKAEFQVRQLAKTAEILYRLFQEIGSLMAPGRTGLQIQNFVLNQLMDTGAKTALRGYRDFQADISVSVNEVAAHGLPDDRKFRPGDLVTVDIAILNGGWYGDMAWTFGIPPLNVTERRLIRAAWQACMTGCLALKPGLPIGTLGSHVIKSAERLGGQVVNKFCGHSIGQELHEAPLIPYTKRPGFGWKVEKGMVLNIEPVVTLGEADVELNYDGISYSTKDRQPTAQFELTCAVSQDGIRILSLPGLLIKDILESPPF
ncbi:type I methionyl aminopeptidase [Salinispira pacifica]|uniref:Methionine aminopeptidase n=1 Tax=Salinispira pacifica TaxID=1307761 RepID=V5WHP4_9SPIO|nr:type I methionyl aminopeptidase [Salinispira pacifica]AHC15140.1 Methionine aminopeptidase [Salinispira pacifica]